MTQFRYDPKHGGAQPAMVMVRSVGGGQYLTVVNNCGLEFQISSDLLRPMPSTITPEQEAVLDSALQYATHRDKHGPYSYEAGISLGRLLLNVDALRESLAPVDPVAEVKAAWHELLRNKSFQHDVVGRMADAVAALEAKS